MYSNRGRSGIRVCLVIMLTLAVWLWIPPSVGFSLELEPLEAPEDGGLDNLDLLEDYASAMNVDISDKLPEEKAKSWLDFAKKWKKDKAYSKQAKRRAIAWLSVKNQKMKADREWARLAKLAENEALSLAMRHEAIADFLVRTPTWWVQRPEVVAVLESLVSPKPENEPQPEPEPVENTEPVVSPPIVAETNEEPEEMATETPVPGIPVKDFCASRTAEDDTKFVRSKLLLFVPGNADLVESGEVDVNGVSKVTYLRKVEGAKTIRSIFSSYFPMKRFETVIVPEPAPERWKDAQQIEIAKMENSIGAFDLYSARCADYIAFGDLTSFDATWRKQSTTAKESKKRKKGKKKQNLKMENPNASQTIDSFGLEVKIEGQLFVYQRHGDVFRRLAKLEGSSGGLLGFASGFSNSVMKIMDSQTKDTSNKLSEHIPDVGNPVLNMVRNPAGATDILGTARLNETMEYVSARPDPKCEIPDRGNHSKALECTGHPDTLPEKPGVPGFGESTKPVCNDPKRLESREGIADCAIHTAAELFTISLQKEARDVDGWRLYAPLEIRGEKRPAFSLGDAEGVTRGMGFHAVRVAANGEQDRVGYARVTRLGPGGPEGSETLSELAWRFGDMEEGLRMDEYPQVGFTVALTPQIFVPLLGTKQHIAIKSEGREALFPPAMLGAGLEVGYDLTPYTFDEFWLRFRTDFVMAPVTDYKFFLVNVQVGPEFRFFMFSRTCWWISLAGNITFAGLEALVNNPNSEEFGKTQTGMGKTGGTDFRTGFDVMANADFYLRWSIGWLQNFSDIDYRKDDELLFLRKDNLSGLTAVFSFGYTI